VTGLVGAAYAVVPTHRPQIGGGQPLNLRFIDALARSTDDVTVITATSALQVQAGNLPREETSMRKNFTESEVFRLIDFVVSLHGIARLDFCSYPEAERCTRWMDAVLPPPERGELEIPAEIFGEQKQAAE
jgi:hypothetical protein